MAFGTGSAVAHRAVDAVMGPRTIQHETVVAEAAAAPVSAASSAGSDACGVHTKAFQDVSVDFNPFNYYSMQIGGYFFQPSSQYDLSCFLKKILMIPLFVVQLAVH